MTTKIVLECSEQQTKQIIAVLEALPQLLEALSLITAKEEKQDRPLKRKEIQEEFQLKTSTFFNLQRRGIITSLRMKGSRLTFYDRKEVLAALQKFNPGKYAR